MSYSVCIGKESTSASNKLLVQLIHAYQKWVSPMTQPRCRFFPTCSEYALEALQIHSVPKALWLITKRLLRCQPFCAGGYDPVPESTSTKCQDNHG